MRLFHTILTVAPLAACAAAQVPVAGEATGHVCKREPLPSFTGQAATQELGAHMLAVTGARVIRWVPKGMMVTMDFREDRLTVYLDGANRVERANCT